MTDHINDLIEAITEGAQEGKVFHIAAPIQATVLTTKDEYRKKTLSGGEEFFFKGARAGKSGRIIFGFEPVDAAPYKQVEFNDAELGKAISGGEQWVEGILGMSLKKAKTEFRKKAKAVEIEEQRAAAEVQRETYAANSLWGSF